MKKGRRTDHWEDEWDNENITVLLLTVEDISVPPCLVSFFSFFMFLFWFFLLFLLLFLEATEAKENQKHREARQLRN